MKFFVKMWKMILSMHSVLFHSAVLMTQFRKPTAYKQLFTDAYNKEVHPFRSPLDQVVVRLQCSLYSIEETSEAKETITTNMWFRMSWYDYQLPTWDPEVEGTDNVRIPVGHVWLPDISFSGILSVTYIPDKLQTLGTLYHDGHYEVTFNMVMKTHCDYDIALYPFDVQHCVFVLGPWEHSSHEVLAVPDSENGDLSIYQNSTEWYVDEFSAQNHSMFFEGENYSEVHYHLYIKRHPNYYIWTMGLPTFVITTLALLGLFAPFNSHGDRQEKVTMGLTTMLSMSVILLVVSDQMPKSSTALPLLGIYILSEISVAFVAAFCTLIMLMAQKRALKSQTPPCWLLRAVGLGAKIRLLKCIKQKCDDQLQDQEVLKAKISAWKTMTALQNNHSVKTTDLNPLAQTNLMLQECVQLLTAQNHALALEERAKLCAEVWQSLTARLDLIFLILFIVSNTTFSVTVVLYHI